MNREEGKGLNKVKMNELLHISQDVLRDGLSMNYDICPTKKSKFNLSFGLHQDNDPRKYY